MHGMLHDPPAQIKQEISATSIHNLSPCPMKHWPRLCYLFKNCLSSCVVKRPHLPLSQLDPKDPIQGLDHGEPIRVGLGQESKIWYPMWLCRSLTAQNGFGDRVSYVPPRKGGLGLINIKAHAGVGGGVQKMLALISLRSPNQGTLICWFACQLGRRQMGCGLGCQEGRGPFWDSEIRWATERRSKASSCSHSLFGLLPHPPDVLHWSAPCLRTAQTTAGPVRSITEGLLLISDAAGSTTWNI